MAGRPREVGVQRFDMGKVGCGEAQGEPPAVTSIRVESTPHTWLGSCSYCFHSSLGKTQPFSPAVEALVHSTIFISHMESQTCQFILLFPKACPPDFCLSFDLCWEWPLTLQSQFKTSLPWAALSGPAQSPSASTPPCSQPLTPKELGASVSSSASPT